MTETGAAGPLTGWTLGGWALEGLLGSGGMGSVYRATRGGDQAAIKVLSAQVAFDEELQRRFQREIKIAGEVRSGRVARLLDAETDGPVPWFATELIEGPTLEDVIIDEGPLTGEALRTFAEGLARAVDDLGQAGVVHRDIKPSNVIVTEWSPILLDFGVATTPHSTQLTATGVALGTPVWMSPEQLVGKPVDAASDVFAWAMTTAYAGTGHHPFGPGELEAVADRIVRRQPTLTGIDPALRRVLLEALDKDPAKRPEAIDVVHAVTRVTMGAGTDRADQEAFQTSELPIGDRYREAGLPTTPQPPARTVRIPQPRTQQRGGRRRSDAAPRWRRPTTPQLVAWAVTIALLTVLAIVVL